VLVESTQGINKSTGVEPLAATGFAAEMVGTNPNTNEINTVLTTDLIFISSCIQQDI
jgi:hypothetical protein